MAVTAVLTAAVGVSLSTVLASGTAAAVLDEGRLQVVTLSCRQRLGLPFEPDEGWVLAESEQPGEEPGDPSWQVFRLSHPARGSQARVAFIREPGP